MDDHRMELTDPKRPSKRTARKHLQTNNLTTCDMKNNNGTNTGKDLFLASKLRIFPWGPERMSAKDPEALQNNCTHISSSLTEAR